MNQQKLIILMNITVEKVYANQQLYVILVLLIKM